MNITSKVIKGTAVLAMVGAIATGSAVSAAPLADMVVGDGYVEWVPVNAGGSGYYTLSVAIPDGTVVKNSFATDEIPVYPATSSDAFDDGRYKYELTLNPEPLIPTRASGGPSDANGRVHAAAGSGMGSQPSRQSGSFRVVNGNALNPNVKEQ